MKISTTLLVLSVLLSSCAKSIVVNYSNQPENNSTYIFQPSKPIGGTYLTINGQTLVENKNVKKITVNKLPEGPMEYHIISESSMYKTPFDFKAKKTLKNGQSETELLTVPPYSNAYWTYTIVGSVTSTALLIVLLL